MTLLSRLLAWFRRTYMDEVRAARRRIEVDAMRFGGSVNWRDE